MKLFLLIAAFSSSQDSWFCSSDSTLQQLMTLLGNYSYLEYYIFRFENGIMTEIEHVGGNA